MGRRSIDPSELFVWFALASAAGWLFESTYSVIYTGRWEKRGFLFGPVCPIYGVAVAVALLLFNRPDVADGEFPAWLVFLTCMVGSAILEYSVSVALERLFGAVWWDYSNLPLNLNGRICLPASLLFGAVGMAIVYCALPLVRMANELVPPAVFEVGAIAVAFALGFDLATTVMSLTDLMERIVSLSDEINSIADMRVLRAGKAIRALPDRAREGGEKARVALDSSQERIRTVASGLTKRQVTLLKHLRRFSSYAMRDNAAMLLDAIRRLNDNGNNGGNE